MTPEQRKYMACEAALSAWSYCTSPSRAIQDVFDIDGLIATEEEIMCGLAAVRIYKNQTFATRQQVAIQCSGL